MTNIGGKIGGGVTTLGSNIGGSVTQLGGKLGGLGGAVRLS